MILFSIIFISIAFVLYTIGVFKIKATKVLLWKHIFYFWAGFCFDTLATFIMAIISGDFILNVHSISGLFSILLMFIHSAIATIGLLKNDEYLKKNYYKFSIIVWLIWLVPCFTYIFTYLVK